MLRKSRIAAVLGVVVLLASACGDGDTPLSPSSAPVLYGGVPIGGSNVVEPPADPDKPGPNAAAASTDPVDDDAGRAGGGHIGGGN